jgi:hypothetical protein
MRTRALWVEPVRSVPHSARGLGASCCRNLGPERTHDQAIDRRAASLVLALGGVALAASPAQALTGVPCDDGDAWRWSIANPAR